MLRRIGQFVRSLRRRYRRRYGYHPRKPIIVQLYRGYRSATRLYLQGRVLADESIRVAHTDRRWRNFVNALRRFASDEVPGATVRVRYEDAFYEVESDDEGYLEVHAPAAETVEPLDGGWYPATAEVLAVPHGERPVGEYTGEVADLSAEARLAIVTDIDDTLLQTGITSLFKLRALYLTLVANAYTRLPFAGAPELYQAMVSGPDERVEEANPVFYLSRSPWNLYDLLRDFLDQRAFPKGPIFLRDVGFAYRPKKSERGHKEGTLLRLIDDFPAQRFVLIGDSGERDADIYHSVMKQFPERIAAVVIRNVKNNANARRIERMFAEIDPGRHFYLVRDSGEAAERLSRIGLLNAGQVAHVQLAARA